MGYTADQVEIQKTVWNYCKGKGLPESATAGVMGNISQESSWDVNEIESGSGIGFGLFQWSYSRRTQLESYGTDLQHQLDFFWSELTGDDTGSTGADKQWINAKGYTLESFQGGSYNEVESATAFCWCWERPNSSLANLERRQSEATLFLSQFTGTGGGTTTTDTNAPKIESAVEWMIGIANDDTHGYDQDNRWGPDYDCSSLVISGYEQAGISLKSSGATYTGDMKNVCLSLGFKVVDWGQDVSKLVRGDILLNEVHHVAVYIGDGQLVEASCNENGHATGGQTGDQTGKEIQVRSYFDFPWDCVLRLGNGAKKGGAKKGGETGGNSVKLKKRYYYGADDQLLGRKIGSLATKFTLVKTYGDIAVISDGKRQYNVPKKNVIKC